MSDLHCTNGRCGRLTTRRSLQGSSPLHPIKDATARRLRETGARSRRL